ncbi:hypothetical protein [Candidatus Avelusimicrobium alvi]|uniref:hypothetical protein n=1 Tax=Candidatus Avelusimicrobium alvi TaxID=3416221 RepID=UPI003D0C3393
MRKWNRLWPVWLICPMMSWLYSCAPARINSRAALCRVRFDLSDRALVSLNPRNQRAVAALEAACGRLSLP